MKTAILCVDDEPVILQSMEMQLRDHFGSEHILEFAETAEEALEVLAELQENNVSVLVVVSDWLMPGMKGDDFLIVAHERFPRIVKIMLTGHADQQAVQRARDEANLFECIRKPWNASELASALERAIAGFHAEDAGDD